ncbi:HAMP domain-containing histidine kinase [Muricauda oceani]|uniref:histidine kinase n=1 Tax=Flagellimonas oceani TaxID=2698672 RepID=A0A6G7J1W1_9FLAO|nr:HAMP domain-containing sensor histidine kinase [Allomuricauda oceani]MBW8241240.1 HAMP domain-containing histidine kinase [Allomuricauda oceani]QII44756.1 HAMP domain-containing histidine kinase [Allomuricauda oceani]
MNKKLFVLLVVLMSLSLLGIIFVQVYWIRTSINDKEEQFSRTVTDILDKVASRVEKREMKEYSDRLASLADSIGEPKSTQYKNFLFVDRDLNSDEILFYSHGILEEDYNITSAFFDINTDGNEDTTTIKNFTSKRTKAVFKEEYGLDGKSYSLTPIQRAEKIGGLSSIDKAAWEDVFMEAAKTRPIHKRVSKQELELLLSQELSNRNIDTDYEYGVYSQGYPTKVRSRKFKFSGSKMYKAPIFKDSEGVSNFSLLLTFPSMKKYIFSSVMGMALLSLVFTLVIMLAYSSAIYQLIKQKRISEIKSDFINNMTHEFKTPIATINLAVEAIRNPKSIEDKEKVLRYLGMIRDENKRMHAQVENVLRISKLEKNQLDITKDRVNVHDIITDAIAHIELIVQDRGGYVNAHLDAERAEVLANDMHMTNVVVNILDNAVKYSPETPKIDVFTEVVKNSIIIKVQDHGAGMSKAVLKKVFEKFYREHTGDIHNVKGHGLGLAYVKRIIDDHQGEVYAESEKGKGSTFFIKLPLI